jgi:hypothetical protein
MDNNSECLSLLDILDYWQKLAKKLVKYKKTFYVVFLVVFFIGTFVISANLQ